MGYFSNGTEGESYHDTYCDRCVHDQDADKGRGCPVWFLHLMHNYDECNKPDSFLHVLIPRSKDKLGNEQCSLFVQRPALEHSDLFEPPTASMTHCPRCEMPYHGGKCAVAVSVPQPE